MQKKQDVSVLQTNGSGVLSFSSVSSDFVLLATTDASSSASVSFDGYYSSTYKNYQIIMSGVVPSAANALFYCRFRRSNADVTTSNYTAINNIAYQNAGGSASPTSGAWNVAYGGINLIDYTSASATYGGINSTISIFAPLNTSGYKHINCQLSFWEPTVAYFYVVQSAVSLLDATTALSGITFYFSTGNITSGNFKLYGIK